MDDIFIRDNLTYSYFSYLDKSYNTVHFETTIGGGVFIHNLPSFFFYNPTLSYSKIYVIMDITGIKTSFFSFLTNCS